MEHAYEHVAELHQLQPSVLGDVVVDSASSPHDLGVEATMGESGS